jgi:glutamine amidotransferase
MKIAVIDYGMGNLRSVAKALEHVAPSQTVTVTAEAAAIRAADRVVFPGQGAIGDALRELRSRGLVEILHEVAASKPFLGICLGLQILNQHSDEDGGHDGLGLFGGQVKRFPTDMHDARGERLKVPQMGWNEVHQERAHPLWAHIAQESRFYFVHSYYVEAALPETAATTTYGIPFTAAAGRDNVFAVQFHPEKSAQAGLQLLQNFTAWDGQA